MKSLHGTPIDPPQDYRATIDHLLQYMHDVNFESFDPFDGLNSRLTLFAGSIHPFVARAIVQFFKSVPSGLIRKSFGVKMTKDDPKVLADVLLTLVNILTAKPDQRITDRAQELYALLLNESIRQGDTILWGLKFPFNSRYVSSRNTPNLFTTVNVAFAIANLYRYTHEQRLLDSLREINRSLVGSFGLNQVADNTSYFAYYPGLREFVYNVNGLALKYLSYYYYITNDTEVLAVVDPIKRALISRQNSDGSWFYSDSGKGRWIDGFHTGYTIEGLCFYKVFVEPSDDEVGKALTLASHYFIHHLLKANFPIYKRGLYPIDSQNCSQAIQTRYFLYRAGYDDLTSIVDMTGLITEKLHYDGLYAYRRTRFMIYPGVFLRWSIAPFALALSYLSYGTNW